MCMIWYHSLDDFRTYFIVTLAHIPLFHCAWELLFPCLVCESICVHACICSWTTFSACFGHCIGMHEACLRLVWSIEYCITWPLPLHCCCMLVALHNFCMLIALHCVCMPCIALCLDRVSTQTRGTRDISYLKWWNVPQFSIADPLDQAWLRLRHLCVFLHSFDIDLCTLGSFGHHALRCVIDGSRAEHYTPLSLRHDKECGCTHIFLQIHYPASVSALLQQKEEIAGSSGRSTIQSTDQLSKLADDHYIWPMTIIFGRWPLLLADHFSACPQGGSEVSWRLAQFLEV